MNERQMRNEGQWGLSVDELDGILRVLVAHREVSSAIIYGSRALGSHRAGSDIDLTLKGELDWADLQKIEAELDNLDLPYSIDLSLASQIENPAMQKHIEQHGQALYTANASASSP